MGSRSRGEARGHGIHALLVALVLLAPFVQVAAPPAVAADVLPVDHALRFDGTSGVAAAPGDVIPTAVAAPFTVEAWVLDELADDGDWRHILSQGQGGTAFYLGTVLGSQEIRGGDTWTSTGAWLPVGRWVHVALTTPGDGTARLYVDGRLAATKPSGFVGPTATGAPFRLGTQYITGQYWRGGIDTVRVWSIERSEAQIVGAMHTALPAGTAGLVAQYLANEGSGSGVSGGSDPSKDLTLSGGVTWETVATTTTVGADTVVSFPRSVITDTGGWTVPDGFASADLLVIAGGGGGGAWVGGGGGAGGMVEVAAVPLTPGQVLPVTVGGGGRGARKAADGFTLATNGQDSSIGMAAVATGGGAGASWEDQQAGSGGSGGGGSRSGFLGAAGIDGQGSRGGDAGSDLQPHPAGGGGGAGAVGVDGSGSVSGAGGAGRSSSITGTAVTYAGGGGGGSHGTWVDPTAFTSAGTSGAGGAGGGGAGAGATAAEQTVRAGDGTGPGGGGGGAGNNCATPCLTSIGGRGGSGIVIVRLTPAVATKLAIDTQPVGGATTGAALATQPVIHIVDADGRLIVGDSTTTVTVAIASGGGALGGTTTVTAVDGVAAFTDITLTADEGVDQVLRFTSTPALTSVDASAIRIGADAPPPPPTDPAPPSSSVPVPVSVPAGEGGPVRMLAASAASTAVVALAVLLGVLPAVRRVRPAREPVRSAA